MAFLFSGQTTDDGQNEKQNIFSQGSSTQTDGAGGGQTDVFNKTSDAGGGSVSRGTSTGVQSSAPSQNVSRGTLSGGSGGYNPKAAQSAYSQIGQQLRLPTTSISRAQGSVQEGQQRLQEESNRYAAAGQQAAAGYKLDQDTLKQAVGGDDKAFQTTAQRLSQARPEVEAFKGLGDKLPDVSGIRDTTRAYAPDAGPNYSAGQSRFDAALLRRSPEFLRMQRQILGDAQRLTGENDKAIEEKTAAQRAQLTNAYNESTDDIRKQLGGLGQEVVTAAQAREMDEDKRRAGLSEADIATQEYAKLKEQIRKDLAGADPQSQQYRSAKYLDSLTPDQLAKYVNVDRDTDWKEFIDKSGADRYNRAMGLLGKGDMLTPAQAGAGSDYEFDQGGAYKEILAQLQGRQQESERVSQSEMDAIIQAAQQRAAGYNDRDSGQDARAVAMQQLADYARGRYANDPGTAQSAEQLARGMFDYPAMQDILSQSIRDNSGADWRSVLLGSEAQKLNELGANLGGLEQYTQGGYRDEIDMDALQKYFDEKYGGMLGNQQVYQQQQANVGIRPSKPREMERKRFADVR